MKKENKKVAQEQRAAQRKKEERKNLIKNIFKDAEPTDNNGTIEADAQPVITSITIRTE